MKNLSTAFTIAAPLALGLALANPAQAEFEISRWTIANGGAINASSGDWTLSGTIGQWESTAAGELSAGPWQLTGGFWFQSLEDLGDAIFMDRFQAALNLGEVRGEREEENPKD